MINELNNIRIFIGDFLGTPLIEKKYLFIDYWTFIHIFAGILLMILIFRFFKQIKTTQKFILLFFIIGLWEVFELFSSWIMFESSIDIFYDLVIGMAGGFAYYFKNR